mmetsp:Transcript_12462/g.20454  ORF Transcript_12462/g.20454 Transcript_12462/m.20454 type:complete len:504 (+) Transcript_12462:86-1597(+)
MADDEASAAYEAQGATLLQDTVDQFEKVIDLERTLLRKSIRKLEHDLEEVTTELSMKEEELVVWEQRVHQIQKDNEVKFSIAKSRIDKEKFRSNKRGRSVGSAGGGSRSLGFIAEVDEAPSTIIEGDEEDEEEVGRTESAADVSPNTTPVMADKLPPEDSEPFVVSHPMVEAINALADIVAGQLTVLQKQWQELNADLDALTEAPVHAQPLSPTPSITSGITAVTQYSASSTPNFTDALRSRLTVEQRIDRLQRDIRNETDRILQERGAPNSTRSASGTPKALLSATTGGFHLGASAGSLVAPVIAGGIPGRAYQPQAGLHTPQSMNSRVANLSFLGDASRTAGSFATGGASFSASRPQNGPASEATQDTHRQESGNIGSSPTQSMTAMSSVAPGIATYTVGKAGSNYQPRGQPLGSVTRCISPTAAQATQARSRPPQYLTQTRSLGMSPTPAARPSDPLQASIGSSGGPPRWTMGSAQVTAPFGQRRTSVGLQQHQQVQPHQ